MSNNQYATPKLDTTFIQPLCLLETHCLNHRGDIEKWFASQWQLTLPPVYGSIDLRNAGFKLAPIDMNLFPAGFNNLNPNFLSLSVTAAKRSILELVPGTQKILVIPENHTRNLFYWENIKTLERILEKAGFEVRLGTLNSAMTESLKLDLPSGDQVMLYPLIRDQQTLSVEQFVPDVILLNNDLSEGIPDILQGLNQKLLPPATLGWSQRLKSEHFYYYAEVAKEFSQLIDIDPWLISPLFRHCGEIDFMQQDGLACLVHHATELFAEIEQKYKQYNIPHQPFLIVKADAGTYGMAVMTVRSVEELTSLNRKQRTRMSTIKGGQPVRKVIIQEGVYTFEVVGENSAVAEPVVYLWGRCVVGGFYRVHQDRGIDENLNAPGMHFEPIAFTQTCNEPHAEITPGGCQNKLYLYGIVAQLSMLAAAREINNVL